jgi:predicted DNA-binding transcriptional regulator YafY
MRDRLYAPIEWDRFSEGYRYGQPDPYSPKFALPGLWFNADEAYALLVMQKLLGSLEPGLLNPHIAPLQSRLNALIGTGEHAAEEVEKRIRIVHAAKRSYEIGHFSAVASATLKRKQIKIGHYNRGSDEVTERVISPLQLVHYRDNWYLDAYCHLRNAIRSFSVDALRKIELLDEAAIDIPEEELSAVLASGYGIFAGKSVSWAKLKFTAERAKWVSVEIWHPDQRSFYEPDGSYVVEIPYSDDRELMMDILKYGAGVEVLEPLNLRSKVIDSLNKTLKIYNS